jgi:hypothetical protein
MIPYDNRVGGAKASQAKVPLGKTRALYTILTEDDVVAPSVLDD